MATPRRHPTGKSERGRPGRASLLVWLVASLSLAVVVIAIAALLRLSSDDASSAANRFELSEIRTPDFHSLAISPADAQQILYGHHGGVLMSDDGGRNWKKSNLIRASDDAMGMGFSTANPLVAFAAGHDTFFKSMDGGRTWAATQPALPRRDIHGLAVVPGPTTEILANVVGLGLYRSADGGVTWSQVSRQGYPPDVIQLSAPGRQVVYAASPSLGVVRSNDGGATFVAVARLSGTVLTVAASATDPETVYAGTDSGLYASSDGGRTWSSRPVPAGSQVMASAVNPRDAEDLVLVSVDDDGIGRVFRTSNGGVSWTRR